MSQHVSTAASFTIFDRLERAATAITPERILALGRENLARAGLTDRKADAALSLADAVAADRIRLDALPADDASALRQLTAKMVRGDDLTFRGPATSSARER